MSREELEFVERASIAAMQGMMATDAEEWEYSWADSDEKQDRLARTAVIIAQKLWAALSARYGDEIQELQRREAAGAKESGSPLR